MSRIVPPLLAVALLAGCATTTQIAPASIVGRWRCGPTTLHGSGFDVAVSTDTRYGKDMRFDTLTRSVISRAGHAPITTQDRAEGTWALAGDVLRTTVQRTRFLSSSDPSISVSAGQQLQDAQLRTRSVFETRLQRIDDRHWRASPVDGSGADASCTRD
jgi:hypothetical protein